jgi:hypothetical protein
MCVSTHQCIESPDPKCVDAWLHASTIDVNSGNWTAGGKIGGKLGLPEWAGGTKVDGEIGVGWNSGNTSTSTGDGFIGSMDHCSARFNADTHKCAMGGEVDGFGKVEPLTACKQGCPL